MPELAFGYLIGFLMTAGLTALHVFLQIRKQSSKEMRFVQSNLKKNNLFWSESDSQLSPYEAGAEKKDLERSVKSILISGLGLTFLSWLGFLLQLVIMLSLRYLAVKRIEKRLFESDLAKTDLDPSMIEKKIIELTT